MSKLPQTGDGTHVATQRGYVGGVVIEPGEAIPTDIPVSAHWMAKGKPKAKPATEAPVEA